jgi:hypothetical protein
MLLPPFAAGTCKPDLGEYQQATVTLNVYSPPERRSDQAATIGVNVYGSERPLNFV